MTNVYEKARQWADQRGDSGGALQMRKALMSLYDPSYHLYPLADALNALDSGGKRMLLECVFHYSGHGETDELVAAGAAIEKSGYLAGWFELMRATREAQAVVKHRWEHERQMQAE